MAKTPLHSGAKEIVEKLNKAAAGGNLKSVRKFHGQLRRMRVYNRAKQDLSAAARELCET